VSPGFGAGVFPGVVPVAGALSVADVPPGDAVGAVAAGDLTGVAAPVDVVGVVAGGDAVVPGDCACTRFATNAAISAAATTSLACPAFI
jgi:hypothetical protein